MTTRYANPSPPTRKNTRLYALIIGIDQYKTQAIPNLYGAVSDSNKVYNWVTGTLGVLRTRVRVLHNAEATREAIVRELRNLSTNEQIQRDDPILIYYAGHGSEGPAPQQWHWDSPKIQMILPHDYNYPDEKQTPVQGIPDRTLGFLLSRIYENKGNNITVIFDCCNSGSGTRSISDDRIRGVRHEGPIPEELDTELISSHATRGVESIPQFRHHGLNSHVLLAACASNEFAHESNRSGDFTTAILKVLSDADMSELTYEGLLKRMDPLPHQTPQCEGSNRTRIIFDNKVPNPNVILKATLRTGKLHIHGAGSSHGIEPGSTFSVWLSRTDANSPPLDIVTANDIKPDVSIAPWNPTDINSSDFFAQLKHNNRSKLCVYVPQIMVQNMTCFQELFNTEDPLDFELSSKDKAIVGLNYNKATGQIGFEVLDAREKKKQVISQTIPPETEAVSRALQHISNYYHHRNRDHPSTKAKDGGPSPAKFSLEVFHVVQEPVTDPEVPLIYRSTGPNLNVEKTGVEVIIEPDKKAADKADVYGFKIHNHTKNNVYPYLFYFNNSTFGISCIYEPEVVTQTHGPLKAHDSLPVGFGTSGVPPQYFFSTEEDLKVELGYLRLYLSTRYIDLSLMVQESLWKTTRGLKRALKSSPTDLWHCITIPVTIKRLPVTTKVLEPITTVTQMVGVIGSRGNGKHTFLQHLLKSANGGQAVPNPTFESTYVKEYTLSLPKFGKEPIAIVDLPGLQDGDLYQQQEAVKATVAHVATQRQHGRQLIALIWCYNVSKTKFITEDSLNLNFAKDLAGRKSFRNITVLTTGWNRGAQSRMDNITGTRALAAVHRPTHPYLKLEKELKSSREDCGELVENGARFKRFGEFSGELDVAIDDPLEVVSDLLKKPRLLQVQLEVGTTRKLTGTAAGRALSLRIAEDLKAREREVQDLDEELKAMARNSSSRLAVQDERQVADVELERLVDMLLDIEMDGSIFV